ncbi:MAG: tetratricopeptide repeat protein [Ignavibacteriales bacterium]|nr:tetratricopeptide repeat protein [Ignavibacteriales bacterium]
MANEERNNIRLFRFLLLLLPLVFFGLLEGTLRLFDYGGDLGLFLETRANGRTYYKINPDVTKRYFRTIAVKAMVSNELFEKQKGANTVRVFCLGESSTLGYPYMFNGSFPSMLKDRLETLWPEKNIEVINLGITAVNSYTVADFTEELVAYQPDALLVYCGHNEFYGALGVSSTERLGKSRWVVKSYLALEHSRTFRLLRDGVNAVREMLSADRSGGREATVMQGMVRNREIAFGSDEYTTARDNFRANLEEIATVSSTHNIKVIFGTLVSNLSGLAPFVSTVAPGLDASKRLEFERRYASADSALLNEAYAEAETDLIAALAVDSIPAKGHFLLGQILERTQRYEQARKEYALARDYDGLRFRAPSEFNDIIHQVAARHSIPVAECEQLVSAQSEHGIIGNRLALEHVHLNVDGYFLIAKAFFTGMADNNVIAPRERWNWSLDKKDNEYRESVRVTPLDSVMAAIRLYVLINSWPFREGGISAQKFEATTDRERLAKSCLLRELTWEQAHVREAELYESQGDLGNAAEEYRALAKVTPFNSSPLLRLGQLLLNAGDDDGARRAFEKSLKVAGSYVAYQGIGLVHLRRKEFEKAAAEFRRALEYAGGIPSAGVVETQQLLAVALAGGGKLAEAEVVAQSIVSAHPEQTQAREILERIRMQMRTTTKERP